MTVTWTSGYNNDEATPLVEWGRKGHTKRLSPAGTLAFTRGSMCGMVSSYMLKISLTTYSICYPKILQKKYTYLAMYLNGRAGAPARTTGWRDPGFIHTSFLKELWPNTMYVTY